MTVCLTSVLELVLTGIIALLVLGPEKLLTPARTAGKWIGTTKRMVSQVTQEIDREIKTQELREKLKQEVTLLGLEKFSPQERGFIRCQKL